MLHSALFRLHDAVRLRASHFKPDANFSDARANIIVTVNIYSPCIPVHSSMHTVLTLHTSSQQHIVHTVYIGTVIRF